MIRLDRMGWGLLAVGVVGSAAIIGAALLTDDSNDTHGVDSPRSSSTVHCTTTLMPVGKTVVPITTCR